MLSKLLLSGFEEEGQNVISWLTFFKSTCIVLILGSLQAATSVVCW